MEENVTASAPQPEPKKKKFALKVPHTYVLLGMILILCAVLTYIIPAGSFDRVLNEEGREIVVNGSYHVMESNPATPFSVFLAIQEGMVQVADIIFFIFFAYGFVFMTLKTGAMEAGIGTLLRLLKSRVDLIIPIFIVLFGIMGSTIGLYEEVYGLIPVFLGIFISLGYDAIVGGAVVVVGVVSGFAAATTNPFTIGIAQSIAGLPMFSGLNLRIVVFVVFEIAIISYTMHYAHKIKKDPTRSIVYGMDFPMHKTRDSEELKQLKLTPRHKVIMLVFLATIVTMVLGTLKLGWYINEIAAVFLIGMLLIGLIGGYNFSQIADSFVEAVSSVIYGALVIGIARAILIVMQNGMIIDSIVYYMVNALQGASNYVAAIGMVLIQNVLNFFIPSGSGQAAATMPIMAPVADLLGLHRQIAVLAYQFGDGFSNLFWPTVVATECGLMGVPLNKWYKFMAPLFGIFIVLQVVFMCIAVAIGYQ